MDSNSEYAAIDRAVAAHHDALHGLWRLIRKVRGDDTLSESERHRLLTELYEPLSFKDIQQQFVSDGHRYDIGVSFRSSMAQMMRLKRRLRVHGYVIAPGGNSKVSDHRFASALGVPVPRTYALRVPTRDVELIPNTIIKPVQGANSRGVFRVFPDGELFSIKTRRSYQSFPEALKELPGAPEEGGRYRWIVEEAILDARGELAPDMKIYMFYGKPGLFIEIRRGLGPNGKALFATYNANEEPEAINRRYNLMEGSGVPQESLELARIISLHTPVPFLRVDLLAGADGVYLGEITPHPGDTYAGDFYDGIDRRLGEYFLEAQARLEVDLLRGKTFEEYFSSYPRSRSQV